MAPSKNALQRICGSFKTGWANRILTYAATGAPIPFVPVVGAVLADVRGASFAQQVLELKERLASATRSDDEIEDLILRAYAAATRAESERKARRLALGAVTVAAAENVEYADAVRLLDDMNDLSDFDMEVLTCFRAEGRAKIGKVVESIDVSARPMAQALAGRMAHVLASIEKLHSRGLVIPDAMTGGGMKRVYSAEINDWTGQLINKGYSISPIGRMLLDALDVKNDTA